MKLKRNIIFFFSFFLLVVSVAQAQRAARWRRMRYEVIYGAGATNFLGELGGANQVGTNFLRDFEVAQTRPLFSIGMRYKILQDFAIKTTETANTTKKIREPYNIFLRLDI